VVGVCQCWTSAYIKNLVVHPGSAARFGPRRCCSTHSKVFQQRREGFVDLKVLEDNLRARRLYESAGMYEVRRESGARLTQRLREQVSRLQARKFICGSELAREDTDNQHQTFRHTPNLGHCTTKDASTMKAANPDLPLPHRPSHPGPRLQPRRLGRLRQNRARQLHQGQRPEGCQTGRQRPRNSMTASATPRVLLQGQYPQKHMKGAARHRAVPVQQKSKTAYVTEWDSIRPTAKAQ
jgi:hypothetical protein